MDGILPSPSRKLYQLGINKDQKTIETLVIEATEFKYEVRSDLGFKKQDCLAHRSSQKPYKGQKDPET